MKFLSKLAALVGAAAFLFTSFAASPASAAGKKMTMVHAHTRVTKSGKVVHVKAHMRAMPAHKVVAVKSYTKVTKTGKVVHVKAHTRKVPMTHKMGAMKMGHKMGKMHM